MESDFLTIKKKKVISLPNTEFDMTFLSTIVKSDYSPLH